MMWTMLQMHLVINSGIKCLTWVIYQNKATKWLRMNLFVHRKIYLHKSPSLLNCRFFFFNSIDVLRWGYSGGDVSQEEAYQTNVQWTSDIRSRENVWADKVLGRAWESETGLFSGHDGVTSQGKEMAGDVYSETVAVLWAGLQLGGEVAWKCSWFLLFCVD